MMLALFECWYVECLCHASIYIFCICVCMKLSGLLVRVSIILLLSILIHLLCCLFGSKVKKNLRVEVHMIIKSILANCFYYD